jgi:hypothetical protein
MLALFLDHPPMFVAGEIALGLSLVLFFGALVVAIADRTSEAHCAKPPIQIRRLFAGLRANRSMRVPMFIVRLS